MATVIYNFNDLKNIELDMSGDYVLGADLNEGSVGYDTFTPIAGSFTGTLDGRDYGIFDMKMPIFSSMENPNVKNLTLEMSTYQATGSTALAGIIIVTGLSKLENLRLRLTQGLAAYVLMGAGSSLEIKDIELVANPAAINDGETLGGLFNTIVTSDDPTQRRSLSIKDVYCEVSIGTVNHSAHMEGVGGLIGFIANISDVELDNIQCETSTGGGATFSAVGGVVGNIAHVVDDLGGLKISNINSKVEFNDVVSEAGGVVGVITSLSPTEMKGCVAMTSSSGVNVGGVLGISVALGSVKVDKCYGILNSDGMVTGGLIGFVTLAMPTSSIEITNSFSAANLLGDGVGGFLGGVAGGGGFSITNCFCNEAFINDDCDTGGGFIGFLANDGVGEVKNCYTIPHFKGLPEEETYLDYPTVKGFVGDDRTGNTTYTNVYWCEDTVNLWKYTIKHDPERVNMLDFGEQILLVTPNSINDDHATPLSIEDLKSRKKLGFDFNNVWRNKEGVTYPRLRAFDVEIDSWTKLRSQLHRGNYAANIVLTKTLSKYDDDYSEMPNWQEIVNTREEFFEGYSLDSPEEYMDRLTEYSGLDTPAYYKRAKKPFFGTMLAENGAVFKDIKTNYKTGLGLDIISGFFYLSYNMDIYDLTFENYSVGGRTHLSGIAAIAYGSTTASNIKFHGREDHSRFIIEEGSIVEYNPVGMINGGALFGQIGSEDRHFVHFSDIEFDWEARIPKTQSGTLAGLILAPASLVVEGVRGKLKYYVGKDQVNQGNDSIGGVVGQAFAMHRFEFKDIKLELDWQGATEQSGGVIGLPLSLGQRYKDIEVKGEIDFCGGATWSGGVIGQCTDIFPRLENVSFEGEIGFLESNQGDKGFAGVGGVAGFLQGGAEGGHVRNCHFKGTISNPYSDGAGYAGGLTGRANSLGEISQCSFEGLIDVKGEGVGGLIGHYNPVGYKVCLIKDCYVDGKVCGSGEQGLGAVVGRLYNCSDYSGHFLENVWTTGIVEQKGDTLPEYSKNIGVFIGSVYCASP